MQYLLLVYSNEADVVAQDQAAQGAMFRDYGAFVKGIVASGQFKAGDALQSVASATTIRLREGKLLASDGPFAETREQLGGYFLIEAADLDEAIEVAARIPTAKLGSIEIRPIRKYS